MGKKGKAKPAATEGEQAARDKSADTKEKITTAKDDIEDIFSEAKKASASAQPAAEQSQQKHTKKRAKNDIDDIFSSAKKAAADPEADGEGQEEATNPELESLAKQVKEGREKLQASTKRPKVEGSKDDIFGETAGKARKRTEEGFTIYSEEELGLGKKGGNTDLCPFDCDCCF